MAAGFHRFATGPLVAVGILIPIAPTPGALAQELTEPYRADQHALRLSADDIEFLRKRDPRSLDGWAYYIEYQMKLIDDLTQRRQIVVEEANIRKENITDEILQLREDIRDTATDGIGDYFTGGGAIGGMGALNAFDDVLMQIYNLNDSQNLARESFDLATGKWVADRAKVLDENIRASATNIEFAREALKATVALERKRAETSGDAHSSARTLFQAIKEAVVRFNQREVARRQHEREERYRRDYPSEQRQTAEGDGVMPAESGSLFDRVRGAHQRWRDSFGH